MLHRLNKLNIPILVINSIKPPFNYFDFSISCKWANDDALKLVSLFSYAAPKKFFKKIIMMI